MVQRQPIQRALLNTDGGSRGNPGESGIGFTIRVDDGRELLTINRGGAYIGIATNNVAEYRALIWGLTNARELGVRSLDIHADSELLVRQIKGEYRVKNEGIKPLFAEVKQLLSGFEIYTISHVFREENDLADALANEAMDTQGMIGDYLVEYRSGDLFSTQPAASQPATLQPVSDRPEAKPRRNQMTTVDSTGTYTLTIKEHFDAAHALIGYPGQCRNLHGHTWDVEVSVCGTELDEVGIVYDFQDLKRNLKTILDSYDHKYLNEVPPFDTINATAENLARIIFEQLTKLLPVGINLVEVAVWESPIARLTYRK